jgi:murein DD-endopeptidase MepM/ murein hydrolase activator NlpD
MSKIKSGIRPGVYVKQGDVIGYVGSTGLATGPHVCYRFWKNGRQVDPYKQKLPPSKPVKEENRADFNILKDSLMNVLVGIPTDF